MNLYRVSIRFDYKAKSYRFSESETFHVAAATAVKALKRAYTLADKSESCDEDCRLQTATRLELLDENFHASGR